MTKMLCRIFSPVILWMLAGTVFFGCSHWRPSPDLNPCVGKKHLADPLTLAVLFYRGPLNHLNAVRTGSCPMHPGCSEYSLQAIHKHGPVIGWIMACDRLMRCGRDELERTKPVLADGQRRYQDPLRRNDWWWHDPDCVEPLGGALDWKVQIK